MIRYILCPACAATFNLHSEEEDIADGWSMRKVPIKAKRPDNHQIVITAGAETNIIPVPVMVCDLGNEELPEHSDCVAVSMWRSGRGEYEPAEWWHEFAQP